MRLSFIILLFALMSCGDQNNKPLFGKTTERELLALQGEPLKEEVIPVENSKILHYENDKKFQITDDIVTNEYRSPSVDESSLLFWKHKFKDCDTLTVKLSENTDGHEKPDLFFKCDSQGVGAVYSEETEIVSRVVEYEIK